MDTFLGIPMQSLAAGMAGGVAIVALILLFLAIKQHILLKMGIRNILRRPSQTILIVLGLMLSTTLFTSSLGVGDSIGFSLNGVNLAQVGNLDEGLSTLPITGRAIIPSFTSSEIQQITAALHNDSNIDTFTSALVTPQQSVAVYDLTTSQVSAENIVMGLAPDFARTWGALQSASGAPLSTADLQPGEVYLNPVLAQTVQAHTGDTVQLLIQKKPYRFTVKAILKTDINPAVGSNGSSSMVVLPLAQAQSILEQGNGVNLFFMKNKGLGGLDDLGPNDSTANAVATHLRDAFPFYAVTTFKADAVKAASDAGATITLVMVAFSLLLVIAGMLLIYLIFVLLAGERQSELGMSRAIGMRRGHLIQLFLFEGMMYTLLSTLLGLPLGIGVTALVVQIANHTPAPLIGIQIHLALQVSWNAVIISLSLGLLVTFGVILFSASRVSRMNIVAAIQGLKSDSRTGSKSLEDLSEAVFRSFAQAPGLLRQGHLASFFSHITLVPCLAIWRLFWAFCEAGPLTAVIGSGMLVVGIRASSLLTYELGVSLLLLGLGLTIRSLIAARTGRQPLADRISFSVLGIVLLFYWAKPFGSVEKLLGLSGPLGLDRFQPADSVLLFLSILAITTGSIWLIMYNGDVLIRAITSVLNHSRTFAPIARASLANALFFKFRTGLIVAMFALVTFIMVSVLVLSSAYQQNAVVDRWTGGWQIQTDSPGLPANLVSQVQANPRLSQEIGLMSWQDVQDSRLQLFLPGQAPYVLPYGLTRAVDDTFLENSTSIHFQAHAAGYSTDKAVWDAVRSQTGLVVIHGSIGAFDPHAPLASSPLSNLQSGFQPFDMQIQDTQGGPVHHVKVIGILPTLFQWPGVFMSLSSGQQVFTNPHLTPKWYLFRLKSEVRDTQVKHDLDSIFGQLYGLQAELVSDKLNNGVGFLENLVALLTGYLALGLLIGVCGLGIISSLSVVERRQQIGMLRALGYSRRLIHWSFLLESGFVTVLGLLIGTGLGIWAIYQAVSVTFLDSDTITIPIATVGAVLICTYLATLLTTLLPARKAAKIRPAVALRYE